MEERAVAKGELNGRVGPERDERRPHAQELLVGEHDGGGRSAHVAPRAACSSGRAHGAPPTAPHARAIGAQRAFKLEQLRRALLVLLVLEPHGESAHRSYQQKHSWRHAIFRDSLYQFYKYSLTLYSSVCTSTRTQNSMFKIRVEREFK